MGDEKQFSYFPEKKGQKSRFWRRKIRDREEYLITMQHAVTAQHEKTHYWNIRNYLFGFRTEIFYFARSRFCQHDAHKYRHIGELNLANISIITPKQSDSRTCCSAKFWTWDRVSIIFIYQRKEKLEHCWEKVLTFELNEERKSLQNGILGYVFRLRFNSRRKVRTVGCHKLIF